MSRATRFDRGLQDLNVCQWVGREYPAQPTAETVQAFIASQTTVQFSKADYAAFLVSALATYQWWKERK